MANLHSSPYLDVPPWGGRGGGGQPAQEMLFNLQPTNI